MQIIESPADLQLAALALRSAGETIALVPTMGNLHEGHLSLVRTARAMATRVIVSDFVNPTQFGPNEDYAAYPRTFGADCALLEREGADIVFHPSPEAMYPEGTSVSLVETSLSKYLCGASRPVPSVCPNCGKPFIKYFGIGTEQIEEAILKSFPEAVPLRTVFPSEMLRAAVYCSTVSSSRSATSKLSIVTERPGRPSGWVLPAIP